MIATGTAAGLAILAIGCLVHSVNRDDRLSARYRSGMGANYPVVVYGFCRWPVHWHMGDEAPTKTVACRGKSA
jgi:hypothetical protein